MKITVKGKTMSMYSGQVGGKGEEWSRHALGILRPVSTALKVSLLNHDDDDDDNQYFFSTTF